jgi:hypothetical protein
VRGVRLSCREQRFVKNRNKPGVKPTNPGLKPTTKPTTNAILFSFGADAAWSVRTPGCRRERTGWLKAGGRPSEIRISRRPAPCCTEPVEPLRRDHPPAPSQSGDLGALCERGRRTRDRQLVATHESAAVGPEAVANGHGSSD